MKKSSSILVQGFLKSSEGFLNQDTDQYIQNLRFIYSAENYCLKRLPRLVNLIWQTDLKNLLSDHTSLIMDRLNRLDQIAKKIKVSIGRTQNPIFKNICNKLGKTLHQFSINSPKAGYELIAVLLEVSIYRSYIYNALLQSMDENHYPEMANLIQQCLSEEDHFFNSLMKTKMYIGLANKPEQIQITSSILH